MTDQLHDDVITYQLEKVDSGGEITDLLEDRIHLLAEAWGYPIEEDEQSPHYGDIKLPDGRHAGLTCHAFIE